MDRMSRHQEPKHETKEGAPKNWMMLNTPNHDAQFLPTDEPAGLTREGEGPLFVYKTVMHGDEINADTTILELRQQLKTAEATPGAGDEYRALKQRLDFELKKKFRVFQAREQASAETKESAEGMPKNWMMLNEPNHDTRYFPTDEPVGIIREGKGPLFTYKTVVPGTVINANPKIRQLRTKIATAEQARGGGNQYRKLKLELSSELHKMFRDYQKKQRTATNETQSEV